MKKLKQLFQKVQRMLEEQVPIPNLQIDEVGLAFDMEVQETSV